MSSGALARSCPGLWKAHEASDGWLVRLAMPTGRLDGEALVALAEASRRFGNGTLEMTRRANLQVRGIRTDTLPELREALRVHLPHLCVHFEGAQSERIFDITTDPFDDLAARNEDQDTGPEAFDASAMAARLDRAIRSHGPVEGLCQKFSLLIARPGASVLALRRDLWIAPYRRQHRAGFVLDTGAASGHAYWVDAGGLEAALLAALARWRRGRTDLDACLSELADAHGLDTVLALKRSARPWPVGLMRLEGGGVALGLGAGLGLLPYEAARWLGKRAQDLKCAVRLSPFSLVILGPLAWPEAESLLRESLTRGFLPPWLVRRVQVKACVGVSGCRRGQGDTRADARAILADLCARRTQGSVRTRRPDVWHLSGCAKGCAGRERAERLFLALEPGRYRIGLSCGPATLDKDETAPEVSTDVMRACLKRLSV